MSFRQVLTLLEYLKNETETAPVTEALTQLGSIYRLLEKRSDLNLVARMKVCFCFFFVIFIFIFFTIHIPTSSCLFSSVSLDIYF